MADPTPTPNSQTKLVAGFVQAQIQRVEEKLDAMAEQVAATAKAVGGVPDRLADRALYWGHNWQVKSRVSWLILFVKWVLYPAAVASIWRAIAG